MIIIDPRGGEIHFNLARVGIIGEELILMINKISFSYEGNDLIIYVDQKFLEEKAIKRDEVGQTLHFLVDIIVLFSNEFNVKI